MSKRVLVTGGAGFIGANLCRRLLEDGHEVIILDNFYTGRRQNIAGLPGVEVIEADVCDPLVALPGLEGVEAIYNLACPASPPHYQRDPIFTSRTCFQGTLNVLELADKNRARVVHASTSEVYGDPEVHPQPEGYRGSVNCTGPRACYDEGKRLAETLCFDSHRHRGTDVGVVRIFNTYGPHMDPADGRVVSNFIVQCLKGEPLTLYGDGQQTRSFCFVDDLVSGLIAMMGAADITGPVNLGNPAEITVRQLGERILEIIGSESAILQRPLPVDDPTRRRPDITLAKSVLGWSPKVDLATGLTKTVSYFKHQLGV